MDNFQQTVIINNQPANNAPALKLPQSRGLIKYILLSLITLGIYGLVVMCKLSGEINTVASRRDGKKTMFYLWAMLLGCVTLGIVPLVWYHRYSARVGAELAARGISYKFGAGTFWIWNIIGCIIAVGPLVYAYKLFKATNYINADYNVKG